VDWTGRPQGGDWTGLKKVRRRSFCEDVLKKVFNRPAKVARRVELPNSLRSEKTRLSFAVEIWKMSST
jgi:hypothetical protein